MAQVKRYFKGQVLNGFYLVEKAFIKRNSNYWFAVTPCCHQTIVIRPAVISHSGTTQCSSCYQRARAFPGIHTSAYRAWRGMLNRVATPSKQKWYGDVSVCTRWRKFQNFLEDMGQPPPGTSLDRLNPFGRYCKENCRWADKHTQRINTRKAWQTKNEKHI